MANHKSALKRERQNKLRRSRNRIVRSQVRTYTKNALSAVEAGEPEDIKAKLIAATKVIAKAGSKGVVKKRAASRKISRLTKQVAKLTAQA